MLTRNQYQRLIFAQNMAQSKLRYCVNSRRMADCGVVTTHVHTHTHVQVQESLDKQPHLVQRIMTASSEFEHLTAGQSVGERETKLKELATGYDAFQELVSNISEGTKVS